MVLYWAFDDPQDVINFLVIFLAGWWACGNSHVHEINSRALMKILKCCCADDLSLRAWAKSLYVLTSFVFRVPLIVVVFLYFQTTRPNPHGGQADERRNTVMWLIACSFAADIATGYLAVLKFPQRALRNTAGVLSILVSAGAAALAFTAFILVVTKVSAVRDGGLDSVARGFFFAVYGIYACVCVVFWFIRAINVFYGDGTCDSDNILRALEDEYGIGSKADIGTEGDALVGTEAGTERSSTW